MKRIASLPLAASLAVVLAACALPQRPSTVDPAIARDLEAVRNAPAKQRTSQAVEQALIPPLSIELPRVNGQALEQRFDLSVRQAPAQQVFMSIVQGTRYSMLLHPDVAGTITVSLKDVTVREALDSLRELYGYEYRVDGTRIFVQSIAIQTRVFRVNYLIGQRQGRTDIIVNSGITGSAPGGGGAPTGFGATGFGSVPPGVFPGQPGMPGAGGGIAGFPGQPGSQQGGFGGSSTGNAPLGSRVGTSTQVATITRNDFWGDLEQSLRAIVGNAEGRGVIVNAQAGVIVVRGMPSDIRGVENYLRAIRVAVERQVMLEAKIVEVTLGDAYQSGVNWAAFANSRFAAGVINPNTTLGRSGDLASGALTANPNARSLTTDGITGPNIFPMGNGSLFGLALQTNNFASLIQFLESQGTVQVLSSPRIAAMNNQKAVLKVGTEEYFVTNVTGGQAAAAGTTTTATTTLPTLTVQPFFSGVALDVLPQIDEDGSVILHVRPTVSNVEQDNRTVNLGTQFGSITLPLARSTASETDSIVRVLDGNIVAIGGLMKIDAADVRQGLPGLQDTVVGGAFGSRRRSVVKRELVVLIKPTVVRGESELAEDGRQALERIQNMSGRPGFIVAPRLGGQ